MKDKTLIMCTPSQSIPRLSSRSSPRPFPPSQSLPLMFSLWVHLGVKVPAYMNMQHRSDFHQPNPSLLQRFHVFSSLSGCLHTIPGLSHFHYPLNFRPPFQLQCSQPPSLPPHPLSVPYSGGRMGGGENIEVCPVMKTVSICSRKNLPACLAVAAEIMYTAPQTLGRNERLITPKHIHWISHKTSRAPRMATTRMALPR